EINSHVYLSSRRRQTRSKRDWSSDVCSSDLSLGVLTVKSVQKYCNPNVQIMGILFTRFIPMANITRQLKELTDQLSEYISAPIYKYYHRSAVSVEEAQANHKDIFTYEEKSTVSEDYKAFVDEFLKGVLE